MSEQTAAAAERDRALADAVNLLCQRLDYVQRYYAYPPPWARANAPWNRGTDATTNPEDVR